VSKAKLALAALEIAGVKLAVAESLTGGQLASTLVDVPGASKAFLGGVVAYATDAKTHLLGLANETLGRYGAVSAETAAAMAAGARERFAPVLDATEKGKLWAVSTTGVAGPELQEGKPAGTVFLALDTGSDTVTRQYTFGGDRAAVRTAAVEAALDLILEQISS
jgi:PncC family amidohydrolase